ncbi:MAG TPA: DUF2007 domain-containing protein [Pseudolabrys sp.]|nr:DUF2007 domain-containing protein [Pseudolabrys sp.]
MVVTRKSLSEHFEWLNDAELLAQFRSGELTELAKSVAGEELRRRGLDVSENFVEPATEHEQAATDQDFVTIARVSTPAEAEMLRSRLEVEGVPAAVADAHTVQALSLMALAVGGVRVLVPASYADRAMAVVKGVASGDFALRNEQ